MKMGLFTTKSWAPWNVVVGCGSDVPFSSPKVLRWSSFAAEAFSSLEETELNMWSARCLPCKLRVSEGSLALMAVGVWVSAS